MTVDQLLSGFDLWKVSSCILSDAIPFAMGRLTSIWIEFLL